MKIRSHLLIGFSLAAASFSLGTARADTSVPISNPSFETLPVGGLTDGGYCGSTYSLAAIPGWTSSGASGQFQPFSCYFTYIPDGTIVGFTNGGSISQTVGATVTPGDVYTLTVYQGTRADSISDGGATADLLVNGTTQYFATGAVASPGSWSKWTATFTGLSTQAGDSIAIELNGTGAGGAQSDFDDVSLSYTSATPEPGYLAALALGLGSLMLAVRRRSAKLGQ
jgi:hypothetical protein